MDIIKKLPEYPGTTKFTDRLTDRETGRLEDFKDFELCFFAFSFDFLV